MRAEGLFERSDITNPGQGDKWTKKDRDLALNEYFEGASPRQLGIKYKGSPNAFRRSIIDKLKYNIAKKKGLLGRAVTYEPTKHRRSRMGKHWTPNEVDFLRAHRDRLMPLRVTAKILLREVKELEVDVEDFYKGVTQVVFSKDLLEAHQFLYWCNGKAVISNGKYDKLKEAEGPSQLPPRTRVIDYEPHIRDLAYYLWTKHLQQNGVEEKKRDAR